MSAKFPSAEVNGFDIVLVCLGTLTLVWPAWLGVKHLGLFIAARHADVVSEVPWRVHRARTWAATLGSAALVVAGLATLEQEVRPCSDAHVRVLLTAVVVLVYGALVAVWWFGSRSVRAKPVSAPRRR